jgi:hypothetical protein
LAVLDICVKRKFGSHGDATGDRYFRIEQIIKDLNSHAYGSRPDLPGIRDTSYQRVFRDIRHTESIRILGLGGAGRGKSHLIQAALDFARAWGVRDSVVTLSTTGSSVVLVRGCTWYQSFGVQPLHSRPSAKKLTELQEHWYPVSLIICDECGKFNGEQLFFFEEMCRLAKDSNRPFGGMHVAFTGDLGQPDLFNRNIYETTANCACTDEDGILLFRYCHNYGFELMEDERGVDPEFTERNNRLALNAVSSGDLKALNTRSRVKNDSIKVPPDAVRCVPENKEALAFGLSIQIDCMRRHTVDPANPGSWRDRVSFV